MTRLSSEAQDTAHLIHSTSIHLLRILRQQDTKTGLNGPRLSALSVIVFRGPITLSDLAAAEQVRSSTMSRIVEALIELGLAIKTPSTEDKRTILISGTQKGLTKMQIGRERRVRVLAKRLLELAPHQRDHIRAAFELLRVTISDL
jgi:DNA-binding MarR family transcriptional regulator